MKINDAINLPLLLLFSVSFTNPSCGQNSLFLGARSFALANSSSTISDEFSLYNNPGSLGYVDEGSISFGYLNPYNIEGLNSVFALFSKSFKQGSASIGVFRFGDEIFQQSKLTMGFGNNFGIASLGGNINYNHYLIEGFGSHGFISLDIGGLAKLSPSVLISGSIKNVTQARISRLTGEYLPTVMSVGISFLPSDQLTLFSQYDKNLEYPGQLNFGVEYTFSVLVLRTGLITDPSILSFGMGLHYKKIKIDYGIRNHQVLRASHCFTVSFHFHDGQQGN
jgi:hypothetical protein